MSRYLLITFLSLCLASGGLRADDTAAGRLIARLNGVEQLSGHFSQTRQQPGSGAGPERSSGSFSLLRPAYFRWEIGQPDHQLVVADGQYLWHFDSDLQTVTRRPLAGGQAQSPLQVLAGDSEAVRRDYDVSSTGRGRFLLVPHAEHPAFEQLTLVFAQDTLSGMEILDNLGQQLLIEFTDVDSRPGLTPEDFRFQPPPGADLFYYDE